MIKKQNRAAVISAEDIIIEKQAHAYVNGFGF